LAGDASITEIDELRPLIAEGQERGFLTFEQIATALEEVEVSKEQVTELHAYLEGEGIDVVGAILSVILDHKDRGVIPKLALA